MISAVTAGVFGFPAALKVGGILGATLLKPDEAEHYATLAWSR
jgi:hypothetical protein